MSQLTNLQRVMSAEDLPSASISSTETKLSALVIAHAILNPYVTKWDIDRFAEPRPHAADKTKYFQYPQWGHIPDPATVLDVHGRVMLWYLPGIIHPDRVEHLNRIHLPLKGSLVKHSKRKNESSKRFDHRHVPELDGRDMDPLAGATFGHGRLMNSPATFQQGHLRLQDKVYESSNLKIPADLYCQIWLELARMPLQAKGDWVVTQPPSGTQWPSIYVGIDVIVNQETPPHLDKVSAPSLLDLLGMEDLPSSALPAPSQVFIYLQTGKLQYDRDTIMRQYVIDGNFTAQHMKMNKPELDVALSDGKGYMVSEGPYQSHLQQSLDSKERSTCNNHRAINAANINKSNLRSTGIGATACAQHGCFVPYSVVDFQKGERYMNTDYSICNALGYGSERITKALVIYDSKSLNFVKGAGHLDGEILETLQEVYDDHMRDSNWKKLVGLVPSLLKKYKTSNKCLEEMNQAYEQLTAVLDPDKVSGWELDALRAEADRGEALDIYLLKGEQSNGQAFFKGLEIDGTFTPQDDPAFCEKEEEEEEDREFWDEG
ncbi:hypothetical protein F5141DRAFT_1214028 [Pisolithus sp. B1]|nr:hypothetical protein F5141DRAFT_1214028 [Pisolithus sp. B1]